MMYDANNIIQLLFDNNHMDSHLLNLNYIKIIFIKLCGGSQCMCFRHGFNIPWMITQSVKHYHLMFCFFLSISAKRRERC